MNSTLFSSKTKTIGLVVSFLICFGAAALGSAATTPSLADWFANLNKPDWNPPNWLFGPVWSTLFAMMAVAVWLVWCQSGFKNGKTALTCFGIQLVLNVGWSVLFFGMQRPDLALIEIVVLWFAIVTTMVLFARHSKLAAGLLGPYLAWVSFASVLNFAIWSLNR
ncbi:MAG: TspO/MBR family protein [Mariniblastus sp.]